MDRLSRSDVRKLQREALHQICSDNRRQPFEKKMAREELARRNRVEMAERATTEDDLAERQTAAAEVSAQEAQRANELAAKANRHSWWALAISVVAGVAALVDVLF